jgi:hypothetical protein
LGETPLEYMVRVMRDPMQSNQRRDEMARAAAPYVHAKLLAAKMEHKQEPELTPAQARDDLIAFLIEHGVPLAPPPPLIEGGAEEVETVGAARIAGPGQNGAVVARQKRPVEHRYAPAAEGCFDFAGSEPAVILKKTQSRARSMPETAGALGRASRCRGAAHVVGRLSGSFTPYRFRIGRLY